MFGHQKKSQNRVLSALFAAGLLGACSTEPTSEPYAELAETATNVDGGTVDATRVTVGSSELDSDSLIIGGSPEITSETVANWTTAYDKVGSSSNDYTDWDQAYNWISEATYLPADWDKTYDELFVSGNYRPGDWTNAHTHAQTDADTSIHNEIQSLSLMDTSLSLSNGGGTVDLAGLTKQTRSIITTAKDWHADTATQGATDGSWPSPALEFAPGVVSRAVIRLPMPADWDGSGLEARIHYTATATGDLRYMLFASAHWAGTTDLYENHTGGGMHKTLDGPDQAGRLLVFDEGPFGYQTPDQDMLYVNLSRQGDETGDNNAGTMKVLIVEFIYTSK